MERLILKKLLKWKNSPYRKPLILKGVRQVGKTWILKEFGRRYYENIAYFNFDENEEYRQFFETTKDVERILQNFCLLTVTRSWFSIWNKWIRLSRSRMRSSILCMRN